MTAQASLSLLPLLTVFLLALLVLAWPLGALVAMVGEGAAPIRGLAWLHRAERALYRVAGVDTGKDTGWRSYAIALVLFNTLGTLFVYGVQRLQGVLPLNPQGLAAVSPDSSFNTAVSFVANTNWQGYAGEQTMSYLTQMVALAGQNFFSAATGMAVVFALIRGFAARSGKSIGNFWVDVTRSTLYVLLPLSLLFAVFLVGQGVIQNFAGYKDVALVDPVAYSVPKAGADGNPLQDSTGEPVMEQRTARTQTLPMGPVASQEAIKLLGTNGGGFFNANSAHPYENPTALSNFAQMIAIFLIPTALCFAFGRMVGDSRQGWAVLSAMTIVFVLATLFLVGAEQQAHPGLSALGVDQAAGALQSGGNMEGKETRFGIAASSLFAAVTTAASCGAVNAMHDSLMPLGGAMPLLLMQFGEVIFGGVGTGLYGMLVFAMLAVFIAGLMIGRTPEYLGKKIQAYEMKMMSLAILATPVLVLTGTAIAVTAPAGVAGIANPGAHGFSEVLYAFTSAANNNGSAFAGLSANTPFYNVMLAIAMWFGRFAVIVPVLAIAGSLARKQRLPASGGTMPTHGPLFVVLLIGVVVLVGVLNYVPALALGPVIEHVQLFTDR
ncbi:potassium-transporting ATPase subunit KdpA [Pseudoduganella plicata]|uniref:Potassium-transporting ATPase potassium-binding subunit n=1 Tax=Pseudoduganella plicata TaxID=321984 RepID=A0A4P7BE89_9BURK|nr:potassium-transporting ATPase subunit KdpA [Pseudoduganella plicata]QBQ36904.1 potassium-transporting ATPase subunit KdpA [Pseudoduganella plicata]GGZ07488.1 potassium-transporting ATPase potassium-binding subunit [Pseudoduganella plicata]